MKKVTDLLKNNIIDCHFHSFGCYGKLENAYSNLHIVDNPIHYKESLYKYFKKYKSMFIDEMFLVIGKNIEDTKNIIKDFPNYFGIGEAKIYKYYRPRHNPETIKEHSNYKLLQDLIDLKCNKPIFIHYDINEDNYKWLEEILTSNPNQTIVLCHCGMNEFFDKNKAFELSRNLQQTFHNLYLDVSWVALDYFLENKHKLANLDNTRLLLGSDNNGLNREYDKKMIELSQFINNKFNLQILKELSK